MQQVTTSTPADARVLKTLSFTVQEWEVVEKLMSKTGETKFIATFRRAIGLRALYKGIPTNEVPDSMKETE